MSDIYHWQIVDGAFLINCPLLSGVFLYFFELRADFPSLFCAFKSFLCGFVLCLLCMMSSNLGLWNPFSQLTNCRGNDYNDAKPVNAISSQI